MRVRAAVLAVAAGLLVAIALPQQTAPAAGPAAPAGSIDAAIIKPDDSGSGSSHSNADKGRVNFENVSLASIIQTAFGLNSYQLVCPRWMRDARFDATVTFTGLPPDQKFARTATLMQPWIVNQFKLAFHHETRQLPGYALVVAKSGPKLTPGKSCCSVSSNGTATGVAFTADTNMEQFALSLVRNVDRSVVVNETGLTGNFHIEMQYVPAQLSARSNDSGQASPGPSIFSAIRQLGLELKPEKIAVDVVVIDAGQRTPAGN